jgi:hypothetical protein
MGGGGRPATDLAGPTNRAHGDPRRRRHLAAGCGCMDPATVSPRRARSRTHVAEARGATADRAIAPDRERRLLPVTDEEA